MATSCPQRKWPWVQTSAEVPCTAPWFFLCHEVKARGNWQVKRNNSFIEFNFVTSFYFLLDPLLFAKTKPLLWMNTLLFVIGYCSLYQALTFDHLWVGWHFSFESEGCGQSSDHSNPLRERLSLMTVTPIQNHKVQEPVRECVCSLFPMHSTLWITVRRPGLLGLALEVASVGALLSTARGPRPMNPLGPEELAVPYRGSTESTSCGKGTWESSKSCRLEDMHFPTPLGLRNLLMFSSFWMVNE